MTKPAFDLSDLADDIAARVRQKVDAFFIQIVAPLVARAGGAVTLTPAELAQPWSLSTLERPDGGLTLVAVALEEKQERE